MEGEFASVSTPELVDQITTLAGHLNAANGRFLALIAELDRRRGWAEWGLRSCAHWLNRKCGIGLGAASEMTREAVQQRDHSHWFGTEPDGSLVIRGRLPAEIGVLFEKTLETVEDSLPIPQDVSAGTSL